MAATAIVIIPNSAESRRSLVINEINRYRPKGAIKIKPGALMPPGLNSRIDKYPALSTDKPGSINPFNGWKIKEKAQGIFIKIGAKIKTARFLN